MPQGSQCWPSARLPRWEFPVARHEMSQDEIEPGKASPLHGSGRAANPTTTCTSGSSG
jgi:hypothetical protein